MNFLENFVNGILTFDFLLFSIPLYLGLMFFEIFWTSRKKVNKYRLNDTVTNLSCGIISEIAKVSIFSFGAYIYAHIYDNFAIFDMTQTHGLTRIASFLLLFFGVDFLFYWYHRMSHTINFLWAGHIVHHQSEEYNLSVALRQPSTVFYFWFFYMPIAILGYPVIWFLSIWGLNLTYQFWIHTKEIGKLGFLENILNTPSHHRVHHGRNPKYLDKNHGGIFIVWDKIFGTFQREEEEPVYGIVSPFNSWNPLWASLSHFVHIYRESVATKNNWDKILVWVKPPDWRPRDLTPYPGAPELDSKTVQFYDTKISSPIRLYIVMQFIILVCLSLIVLHHKLKISVLEGTVALLFLSLSLASLGGLFDSKSWSGKVEFLRHLLLIPIIIYFANVFF